jgi:predicted HD phosphohydrolase
MISSWLETPIIIEYRQHILLNKRYIDNLFVVWFAKCSKFSAKFKSANGNILLDLEW